MNFLVDENLPARLCSWLSEKGYEAAHVSAMGFGGRDDSDIWAEAQRLGACIITRDADFIRIASAATSGRVVRLLIGNCATPVLLARLQMLWPEIEQRLASAERLIEIG